MSNTPPQGIAKPIDNLRRPTKHYWVSLKKKLSNKRGVWAEGFPRVLWVYRTTTKTPTGQTSFSLSYESEVVVFVEIGVPNYRVSHFDEKHNQRLEENLDLFEEMRKRAEVRTSANNKKAEHYFNRRIKPRSFKVGDLVLMETGKTM